MNGQTIKSMGKKKFILEAEEEQLQMIANCVEDCHRFASGQTDMSNTTSHLYNFGEVRRFLKKAKELVVPKSVDFDCYDWTGYGCPNKHQKKFIARSYPIYRDIKRFFALRNKRDNVYSSGDTMRCAESGEPIMIKAKDEIELFAVTFRSDFQMYIVSMHTDFSDALDSAIATKKKHEAISERMKSEYGISWCVNITRQNADGKMGGHIIKADNTNVMLMEGENVCDSK